MSGPLLSEVEKYRDVSKDYWDKNHGLTVLMSQLWDEIAQGGLVATHVVDIGCGNGVFAELLGRSPAIVTAFDVVDNRRFTDAHDFELLTDYRQLAEIRADLYTAWDVLEHIPEENLPPFLAAIRAADPKLGFAFTVAHWKHDGWRGDDVEYHVTVKPWEWWLPRFLEAGFRSVDVLSTRWQGRVTTLGVAR